MNKNTVLTAVVLIVIVLVAAWYFMWRKPTAPAVPAPAAQGLGADIYNKVAPNAASNLPQTNPYKAVQTNPFSQ